MDFTVKTQFKTYLKKAGLPKEEDLPPSQKREVKRAFRAAYGQCLVQLREEVSELPDLEAVQVMQNQLNEVSKFWEDEANGQG